MSTRQIDLLNIGLMLISIILAVKLPFHVFLMSYAILGPLHYLTEIGWLDDRNYFANRKKDVWILVGLCGFVTLAFAFGQFGYFDATKTWMESLKSAGYQPVVDFIRKWEKSAIFMAFFTALIMAFVKRPKFRYPLMALGLVAAYFLNDMHAYVMIIGVMLPTVIHVYVFTGLFILYGALKSKSVTGFLSLLVFVSILFFIVYSRPTFKNQELTGYWLEAMRASRFADLNAYIADFMGWEKLGNFKVFSRIGMKLQIFLAFAYTYHYLNWFSKTKVINWHKISRPRLYTALAIWVGSIALYLKDYKMGLAALFFLSLLHVFLEFPLNHRTFVGIYQEIKERLTSKK